MLKIVYHYVWHYYYFVRDIYFAFASMISGGDPRFQVGGGGAHLKKLRRAKGGENIFGGISCEKSRFYAKKSYFFQF